MQTEYTHPIDYMKRAIELARFGLYTAHPNPRVGCVIVKDGKIIGEGFHARAGQAHAEVNALAQAGDAAKDADVYVTLEPCSHTGKTPPCSHALVEAGVARVFVAVQDVNPQVLGRGVAYLESHGIACEIGLCEDEARVLNAAFFKRMQTGLPYVRLKLAMSLDGRTALENGESQWITDEVSRQDVQRLRAQSDCILTGSGTVLADNPQMNVRLSASDLDVDGEVRQPLRAVIDTQACTESSMHIYDDIAPSVAFVAKDKVIEGVECLDVPLVEGHADLQAVLKTLGEREINEVLLECGSTLAGAFVQASVPTRLVDEIVLYIAPKLMGDTAQPLLKLDKITSMLDLPSFEIMSVEMLSNDIKLTLQPK